MKIVLIDFREWTFKAFSNFKNLKILKKNQYSKYSLDHFFVKV